MSTGQKEQLDLEADRIVLKSMIGQYESLVGVTQALPVTMPLTEAISAIDRRLLRLKLNDVQTLKVGGTEEE